MPFEEDIVSKCAEVANVRASSADIWGMISIREGAEHDVGRVRRLYAAIAAALFLAGFLYAFWRVGKSWPGVPPATDGIFHLKQVCTMQSTHLAVHL